MKYAYKCKQCGCEFEKDKPLSAKTTSSRCPKCGKKMILRDGRYGPFFACSAYPECKTTMNVGDDGKPIDRLFKDRVYPLGRQDRDRAEYQYQDEQ